MTRSPAVNVSMSVRTRLRTLSKQRGEDFDLTLVNFASERFLYRLSRSSHRDRFVLKGAMLFVVRLGETYRPTRDIDFLGYGDPSEAAVETAVREILATPVDDDGLRFDAESLKVQTIREDTIYGGIRANLRTHLGTARIAVQADVGFGDAITPEAGHLTFPTLLRDLPAPEVLAYPMETVVAEKVEAMVSLGMLNSRMKDFFDVAIAARRMTFDGETLVRAIRATFTRRGTSLPDGGISALSDTFSRAPAARAHWETFRRRTGQSQFVNFEQVLGELRAFLAEPMRHAGQPASTTFAARWSFERKWT